MNSGPLPCQGSDLPTDLQARVMGLTPHHLFMLWVKIAGVEGRAKPEVFYNSESEVEDQKDETIG